MLDNDNDNDNDSDNDNDKSTTVTYRLKFIDSCRFMQDSLSNLVDNLSEVNNKKLKNKFTDNMRSMIDSLSQSISKVSEIDNKITKAPLTEKFPNTYQLCNKDLNKFALLLRKGVYLYEYMDNWERFNEAPLPDKESFYSELNKEGITDDDYVHAQKVWKVFKIKDLGEYYDLYAQTDTLLLADVYEKFRDK